MRSFCFKKILGFEAMKTDALDIKQMWTNSIFFRRLFSNDLLLPTVFLNLVEENLSWINLLAFISYPQACRLTYIYIKLIWILFSVLSSLFHVLVIPHCVFAILINLLSDCSFFKLECYEICNLLPFHLLTLAVEILALFPFNFKMFFNLLM